MLNKKCDILINDNLQKKKKRNRNRNVSISKDK